MILVAILTVKKEAIDAFREYETHAAEIMKNFDGRIERTVVVQQDCSSNLMKEIHVVTFPDETAYVSYRQDKRMVKFSYLRDQSVVHTEIFVGEEGPRYSDVSY